MRFFRNASKKVKKVARPTKMAACAVLWGRAQTDVLQLTREKKGQKVETKEMFDVPEIKN